MSDGFKDIRDASQKTDAPLREMLSQMRQALHWLRDNTPTIRELQGAGLADERGRLLPIDLSQIAEGAQGPAGEQGPPGAGVEPPDLTQPPTPTGLTAVGALASVIAQWGNPSYTAGHGHKQTNIYATKQPAADATLYTIADAVRVSAAPGAQTIASVASDPDVKWRIWIKWESNDGVESPPAGGVNGVVATTGQDVSALLAVLSGELTATQLAAALSTRIDLIDGPDLLAGSVAARVKAEQDARIAALSDVQGDVDDAVDRVVDLEATVNSPTTGVAATASALDTVEAIVTHGTSGNSALASRTAVVEVSTAALQNAGGNRVSNSSFELDTDGNGMANGFAVYNNGSIAVTTGPSGGYVRGYAQRVDFTGTPNTSTQGILVETANPDWVPGKTYVISFYAKGSGGQIGRTMDMGWNAGPSSTTTLLNPPLSSEWQRYAFRITWGASVETGGQIYLTSAAGSPARNGILDFDDLMVQEGDTLTAYTQGLDGGGALSAAVLTEQTARAAGDAANASSISTVNARLNSGGDVANAIVSVSTTASTALANAATAQATADSTASLITTVQSSLANAAGNQAINSSFEVDTNADGFADGVEQYNNGGIALAASLIAGRVGGKAQRINFTGTANTAEQGINVLQGNIAPYWLPLKTYVVSFYAKGSGGQVGRTLSLQWNTYPTTTTVIANPALSADWQRYAFKITWGASVEPFGMFISSAPGSPARNGILDFDDLMVQEGDALTAYTPGLDGGGALTASVQTEAATRASQDGLLFAKYGVKLDVNGYTIGWAANNDGVQGTIVFRTDTFIVGGTGYSPVQPFIIRTSSGTEGGVSYPAGVYMDSAYITNLTAMWARFGTLVADSVQATEISAARLTVGTGAIGGNLRSTTYTGGSIGWIVRPDGYAEFNNVVVRGTVYASAGAIGGSYIGSTYIQSTTWVSGSNGWRFNSDGTGWVGGIYMDTTSIRSANYILNSQGFALRADGTGQIGGLKVNADSIESSNYVAGTSGMRIGYNGDVEIDNLTARGNITASSLDALTADIVQTIHVAGDAVGSNKFSEFQGYTPTGWNSLCSITQTGFPANSKSIVFFELFIQHLNALSGSTATLSWAIKCNGVDIYGPVPTWTMTFAQSRTIALRPIAHTSSPVAPVYSLHVYASNSDVHVSASITVIGVKK